MSRTDYKHEVTRLEAGMSQVESRWFHSLLYEFPDAEPSDMAELAMVRAAAHNQANHNAEKHEMAVV